MKGNCESPDTLVVNGVEYIKEKLKAGTLEGMEYCIVRTYSAGVFAGYVAKREGQEVTVRQARRLWSWAGAASLSQLAMEGTSKPEQCKFPCEVTSILLTQAIEIIPCTEKAKTSIAKVAIWKA